MYKSFMKITILNFLNESLIKLPSPVNISIWWNLGSLLGLSMIIQIITGLFLSMHYSANTNEAFKSMIHIIQDVNYGWLFRLIHMNGASMFFMMMFLHISRGIYYGSYKLPQPWISGTFIFLISMMTAFMGYVLPWGQMSFWGATVITNLISTIPYIGQTMTIWIWGGFSVNNPTLNRFFTMHFILPFFILFMILIHLILIHMTGSSNPLGSNSNIYKITFHPYYTWKDTTGFTLIILFFLIFILTNPYLLNDPENFINANSLITPIHIQPEWYFLFAYTILRAIPNKLGGVIALFSSILILLILPLFKLNKFKSLNFYPINQIYFWTFITSFILLTWLGMNPIEPPYTLMSQILTTYYFMFYLTNWLIMIYSDWLLKY